MQFSICFFPSLILYSFSRCASMSQWSCASLGQETNRRRTLYPNIFSVQQDRGHRVNADPLTRCWLGWCWLLTSCQWRAPCGQLVMIDDQQSSCISTLLLMKRSSIPHRDKTYSQNRDTLLCRGVTKNLTPCRIHIEIFKKYHVKAYDQSFPMMYNTI